MGKARNNRNLGFNLGYVSESSMQNMADDLYHRTESYVKRPKEVHQKHHFGERTEKKEFTVQETLQTLLDYNQTAASPDLYVRIARCYLQLKEDENAKIWLQKALRYEHPEAKMLMAAFAGKDRGIDCQMKARRDRMSWRLVLWMETKTCLYCHKKRLCADFHYCPMCGKTLPR